MNSGLLQQLLVDLGVLSALVIIGVFLRAKVLVFQRLLLPAPIIGGAIGLLLGPLVLGDYALLRVSDETIATWAILPGILIVPIFAAVPFGNGLESGIKRGKQSLGRLLLACGSFSIVREVQLILGFGFTLLVTKLVTENSLYKTFGFELSQGFSGGHGTAGGVGNILQEYGLPYWETAQGIATTFATIGLIGGMLLGILIIHRQNKISTDSTNSSASKGFEKDVNKQGTLGRESMDNSSVETITLHLGVILVVCAMAYKLLDIVKVHQIWGISSIPVWFLALLLMYVVNALIKACKLTYLFDKKVKNKIVGSISDFAIVAAMASIPIQAVIAYWVPILILAILGFVTTYFLCFPIFKKLYGGDDWFERGILTFGVNTGVTINGMLLLKICDPNYESKALEDFSMGFALMSVISLVTFPIMYMALENGSTLQNLLVACGTTGIYLVMTIIGKILLKQGK